MHSYSHNPRLTLGVTSALCVLGLVMLAASDPARAGDQPALTVVKAGRIHTLLGEPIDHGLIIIQDGRIVAVGAGLEIPDGAVVLDCSDAVITPGLIDACCVLHTELRQAARGRAYALAQPTFWEAVAQMQPEDADRDRPSMPLDEPLCPMPHGPAGALAALTPGDPPNTALADQSAEVTPHRRVLDSVNLLSKDFDHLLRSGVTTVYVSPDSANVIGARGAILRTGGPQDERVLVPAAAVKVTLGEDPSYLGQSNNLPPWYGPPPDFHTRRPTTRMGVDWVFRKALYDARRAATGLPLHGADVPPAEALPVLRAVLAGDVPVRVQARMQNDIFSALRLAREFGLSFTLEEATEAYRCLPQLKAAGVPVILGPLFMEPTGWRANTSETQRPRLNSASQLAEAGITFALTAQELREEDGLVRQGMIAVRHGLAPGAALRAITAVPAEMIGFKDELGTLAVGARADLVAWSAEPFDATSRPRLVLIDGRVVYED